MLQDKHGMELQWRLILFNGYWVIGKDKTIYNVVAKDMTLSCISNVITQGTACVGHGIEEWESNKGHLYTYNGCA